MGRGETKSLIEKEKYYKYGPGSKVMDWVKYREKNWLLKLPIVEIQINL